MVGAGLGARSLRALTSVDPGFDLDGLMIGTVSLPSSRYATPGDRSAFWDRARASFEALPDVRGLTTSGVPPFGFSTVSGEPYIDGDEPPVGGSLISVLRNARWQRFIFRTDGDPMKLVKAVRARLHELDPGLALRGVTTGEDLLRVQTADPRFLAVLLGVFGAMSLLVAALSVYGSVSLSVSRRTRELGVRRALGAGSAGVVRLVLRRGLLPVLLGSAVGAVGATVLGRYLSDALYRIKPTDPATFAAGALILTGVATLACLVPARRALRVDPVTTLRDE